LWGRAVIAPYGAAPLVLEELLDRMRDASSVQAL
jgi:hypothetical protein